MQGRRRGERGAVTAEAAVALPLLVAFTIGLVWLIGLGIAQARVVDAARETARAIARDDPEAQAVALGQEVAPPGAHVSVSEAGGRVVVEVSAPVAAPGGLFARWGEVTVSGTAVGAVEDR